MCFGISYKTTRAWKANPKLIPRTAYRLMMFSADGKPVLNSWYKHNEWSVPGPQRCGVGPAAKGNHAYAGIYVQVPLTRGARRACAKSRREDLDRISRATRPVLDESIWVRVRVQPKHFRLAGKNRGGERMATFDRVLVDLRETNALRKAAGGQPLKRKGKKRKATP